MHLRVILSTLVALFALTHSSLQGNSPLDDGLIGYWPLNGDADDHSGNAQLHHGDVLDGAHFVPNPTGEGQVLQAVKGDRNKGHVRIDLPMSLYPAGRASGYAASGSLWVWFDDREIVKYLEVRDPQWQSILGRPPGMLYVSRNITGNKLYTLMANGDPDSNGANFPTSANNTIQNEGMWYHVAWTMLTHETGETGHFRWYVNGVPAGEKTNGLLAVSGSNDPVKGGFRIGSNHEGYANTIKLSEVRLYNRILAADEISALAGQTSVNNRTRFWAMPHDVTEGDTVQMVYYNNALNAAPLDQITDWRWDVDGDSIALIDSDNYLPAQLANLEGIWEDRRDPNETSAAINYSWLSIFDENKGTSADRQYYNERRQAYTPVLMLQVNGRWQPPVVGITEDRFGSSAVDPEFFVKAFNPSDGQLRLSFRSSKRLAQVDDPITLYSEAEFINDSEGKVLDYYWDVDQDLPALNPESVPPFPTTHSGFEYTVSNPEHTFPNTGSYAITLMVAYQLDGDSTTYYLHVTKEDFIKIIDTPSSLQLGRAYRRGFPEEYGWEDIVDNYAARGANNNRYVYFDHLVQAFDAQKARLTSALIGQDGFVEATEKQLMSETVNELLQGQNLIGNDRLIEALRIKYPRLKTYDPLNPPEDLPDPVGAREETAAIDIALNDYQLPIHLAATAIKDFGSDILRPMAAAGTEPFPQFPRYLTFEDDTLSQTPIPIKNDYWQLTTSFERMALGRNEKAKKLFRLSAKQGESTAREEARVEAQKTGIQSYLGMALLAAGQTESQFERNGGSSLLAHIKNARNLFEAINDGANPLINDGSFIPNESFDAIYQDALDAIVDAREAQSKAGNEERDWEQFQAQLRNELLSQRANYITPLFNLTAIDPSQYNNLQTINDQADFKATLESRLATLDAEYPAINASIVGQLGEQFIAVKNAEITVETAENNLANLYRRIDISKWQNATIDVFNEENLITSFVADELFGNSLALASFSVITGASSGGNFKAALAGAVETAARKLERALANIQQATISDIQLEAEIRTALLSEINLQLDILRAKNNLNAANLSLDNTRARIDRLIADLAHTRSTAEDLYFNDPSFAVVVSDAMRRAEYEIDYAVDRLYRLAKTLEYHWAEGYQNPIVVPTQSYEPAALENPLFDQFTDIDSVFFVRGAKELKDYLDALKAWDSKLRRINVSSVRGPNFSGPVNAQPISMREQLLGFKPGITQSGTMYTFAQSVNDFRSFMMNKNNRVKNKTNNDRTSFQFSFPTVIHDNRYFPDTGSRWNMRIDSIAIDVIADNGFNTDQIIEVDLIQNGTAQIRTFWADAPLADDIMSLTFNSPDQERSAFAVVIPAKINGLRGLRPESAFFNYGLQGRPIGATEWILKIDTDNPVNRNIDFSKIRDIFIRFTYTYGNPQEFANF